MTRGRKFFVLCLALLIAGFLFGASPANATGGPSASGNNSCNVGFADHALSNCTGSRETNSSAAAATDPKDWHRHWHHREWHRHYCAPHHVVHHTHCHHR